MIQEFEDLKIENNKLKIANNDLKTIIKRYKEICKKYNAPKSQEKQFYWLESILHGYNRN